MVVITTKKSVEEVLASLKDINKVAIITCGTCAALCQTGGTDGLKYWTDILEKEGYDITVGSVIEEVCDNRVMRKDLRKMADAIENADAILTASCGLGTQSIVIQLSSKYPIKPVITANDTQFMGMTERIGRFHMRCLGCGDCLLNETGGVCPIATCAKALMNGPCGGMVNGKCEVGNYVEDCGWVLIFNRLKEMSRLDLFVKLREPRDWSDSGHQRHVIFR